MAAGKKSQIPLSPTDIPATACLDSECVAPSALDAKRMLVEVAWVVTLTKRMLEAFSLACAAVRYGLSFRLTANSMVDMDTAVFARSPWLLEMTLVAWL